MPHRSKVRSRLTVKICSDRSAFEVRPMKRLTLNLSKVKLTLERIWPHEIVVDTPHIIIVRSGKAETTLSRDGRMLIKRVLSEAEATRVAQEILDVVLKQC